MSLSRKISIGALFGLGWICMAVSIIRVVELGNNWGNGTPEPVWLALWGIIEGSVGKISPPDQPEYAPHASPWIPSCHHRLLSRTVPRYQSAGLKVRTVVLVGLVRIPDAHRQRRLGESVTSAREGCQFLATIWSCRCPRRYACEQPGRAEYTRGRHYGYAEGEYHC